MALWPARYGAEHPVDVLHRLKRSVNIKVERQLHDMRILDRVLCASGTRLATTEVAIEMWKYEVRNNP